MPAPFQDPPGAPGIAGRSRRSPDVRMLRPADPAPANGRFAWLVTGAHLWILVGLFLDGWFHIHAEAEGAAESFFTPWHAVLYSGVAATVAVHLLEASRAGGVHAGYGPSVAGGIVVLLAGAVDGTWHTVLGVEADLEALLSPPHLLLITAGTLVFAGPLRAALRRSAVGAGLPTALSAAFVVTGLAFFSQYANPLTHLYPVVGYSPEDGGSTGGAVGSVVTGLREVAGVSGVVVWAVLVGGALALVHARTARVPGSLFAVVAVPSLFMTTQRSTYEFVPAVLVAALAVELLGRRTTSPSLVALAATTLLTTGWALTLSATQQLAWSVELLGGSIGSAAAAGYLVGWLVQSSRAPREHLPA